MDIENYELDISSLKKAITSLESSLNVYEDFASVKNTNEEVLNTLRAGVIQKFEFTYELAWKMMKRWLDLNLNPDVTLGVTKKELFRLSAENALIGDVSKWFTFQTSRNRTSHTYSENVAEEVFVRAKEFLPYVKKFYTQLEKKI